MKNLFITQRSKTYNQPFHITFVKEMEQAANFINRKFKKKKID